jgi:predicted GTPase
MIRKGIESIPVDNTSESAILVIGDTGVGKSTIMSFLSGAQLTVRLDGLKPSLDNREGGFIKIGHQKFSETSVPTKIVLENMAFYDCPGFKDNKGEEYEISNSFFIQRLLDIYKKVKLVLIVDETHISETRADKFPKLIKSLGKAFKTFEDIKDGVFLIVNRADKDQSYQSYIR